MAYKYDENSDTSLKEYFQKYKENLPRLAIITGGVYGKTKYDDFASDQVVRLHRFITQQRVLAKQSTVSGRDKHFSIPLSTDIKFQVIKGRNKLGSVEDLKTILKHNQLPVLINIVSHVPSAIDKTKDGLAQLLLTEEYTEIYFQGHCIYGEKLNPADVSTLIVIPDVTIADIEGFVDKPEEEFQDFLKRLDEQVKTKAKFNDKDVDTDIRVIEVKEKTPEVESDHDSGQEYDYVEPPMPKPRKVTNDGKQTTTLGRPLPSVPSTSGKAIPNLPPRGPLPIPTNQQPLKEPEKKHRPYENQKVNQCTVSPIVKKDDDAIYEPEEYGQVCNATDSQDDTVDLASKVREKCDEVHILKEQNSSDHDVSTKSISDIIEILNLLKLDKYSEMFQSDMVDGMTLEKFSEDALKQEYGMRHAEAVRLMNYVRSGHVPK